MKVRKLKYWECVNLVVTTDGNEPDGLRKLCEKFNTLNPNCTNACPLFTPLSTLKKPGEVK